MSTFNFENKTVTSDGITTKVITNGIEQTFTKSSYTASTPLTATTFTQANHHIFANSRNIDIKGNSQESYAGRGVTAEYSIKVIGTPELFTGDAQRGADEATSELLSLLLQQGENGKFEQGSPLTIIDPAGVFNNMASSLQGSLSPELSPISTLEDIPIAAGKLAAWGAEIDMADAAEQAARAGQYEIERQERRLQNSIEAGIEEFGASFDPSTATSGNPASDANSTGYTLSKSTMMNAFYGNNDALLAYQRLLMG